MQIDLSAETPLTLAEAAKIIPGSPSIATLWRWVQNGCRGNKLESFLVAGRRYTTHEAISRFIARSNGSTVRQPSTEDRRIAAAAAYCESQGG